MLTGDNRGMAEAVARETGVDVVRAELLPAEKVSAIDELLALYGVVAMIGDRVNDAPRWRARRSPSRWERPGATPRSRPRMSS